MLKSTDKKEGRRVLAVFRAECVWQQSRLNNMEDSTGWVEVLESVAIHLMYQLGGGGWHLDENNS